MADNEKLRALLAEARERLQDVDVALMDAQTLLKQDAALAESVDDYDVDADLRMHKEDRLRLRSENLRFERERNEARAEIEKLRAELTDSESAYGLGFDAGFRRGREAMREAVIQGIILCDVRSPDKSERKP